MTFVQYVYTLLLTIPVFAVLDLVWLGIIANNFYQSKLAHLLGAVHWPGAIAFYLLYVGGILFFAVSPALAAQSLAKAFMFGCFLGLFAYGTYDLTNYATLKDWPLIVVVVDMVWGALLTGAVAAISYYLARTFVL